MMKFGTLSYLAIHRHTGGLESAYHFAETGNLIHRHTGGLEMRQNLLSYPLRIHRHTGGLENHRQTHLG